MPEVSTITNEKLCQLTGLTDRRHRQLAKDGWFPPPLKGEYQLVPTLQGLFKFYRSKMETNVDHYIKEEKLRRERNRNERDEKQVIPFTILEPACTEFMAELASLEQQRLINEWPVVVAKCEVEQARHYAMKLINELQAARERFINRIFLDYRKDGKPRPAKTAKSR